MDKDSFLNNYKNYYTGERLLQITIESCIDIGNHLIAMNSWDKPNSYREIFEVLANHNVITKQQVQQFRDITGFRNIIVHKYFKIEREVVYSIIQENLEDIEQFIKTVITQLGLDFSDI